MFQVRCYDGSIQEFEVWATAKSFADNHGGWKISFPVGQDRIRLIRQDGFWVYQSIHGNY